jgi:hypothetical protein
MESSPFDDPNLVSCVELAPVPAPVLALAERAGLHELVAEHVRIDTPGRVNSDLKIRERGRRDGSLSPARARSKPWTCCGTRGEASGQRGAASSMLGTTCRCSPSSCPPARRGRGVPVLVVLARYRRDIMIPVVCARRSVAQAGPGGRPVFTTPPRRSLSTESYSSPSG